MYQIDFEWDTKIEPPKPGQFFTVRVSYSTVPLLRRPFAFSAFNKTENKASGIYQVRGSGTRMLSAMKTGEYVDIIAPLGKPFPEKPENKVLLIAGGIGIGPILFLRNRITAMQGNTHFIFGCRSGEFLPNIVKGMQSVSICSDDGSVGFKGTVTDYLGENSELVSGSVMYCCGPYPMLRTCHRLALEHDIDCFISVEQVMACGVGACMGCVVRVHGEPEYVRACKEGPVFNSREIEWDE